MISVYTKAMVTVYTREGCTACRATLRFLSLHGMMYKNILAHELFALDEIQSYGHENFPVVVVSADTHWSGHQPTKLAQLIVGQPIS